MYDVHVDSTLSVKVAANLDEHKEVAGNRFKDDCGSADRVVVLIARRKTQLDAAVNISLKSKILQ